MLKRVWNRMRRRNREQDAAMAARLHDSRLMKDELIRKASEHGKEFRSP
jgi:hypothetical protein